MRSHALALKSAVLSLGLIGIVGCSHDDQGGGDDAGAAGLQLTTTSVGPFDIAAGEEKTVCIVKRLDNTADFVASSFAVDLAPVSHHLIVYSSNATDEQLTPFACRPFEGIVLGAEVP